MNNMPPPCRIILLLDLDCFYAQCERVRLGLDPSTTCLALLQWNSTLAVTYPARRLYDIKRGDSWDEIRRKSNNDPICLALHLPILQKRTGNNNNNTSHNVAGDTSIEQAYENEYHLSTEQRQHILKTEVGVRRSPDEGKACLERYRIASSRIFSVVMEALVQHVGKDKFVLERASIDELFLDVTSYCWDNNDNNDGEQRNKVMEETVIVGGKEVAADIEKNEDRHVVAALERGCVVAKCIREAVLQTLGFTMSAGISTCKLVAKLGASYGKPNGQAIIFPQAIPHVMEETKIRKVRHFGGKIGKKVQALLPPGEETMGSIARLLSLPVLCKELGSTEMGRMVFDACRGIDSEAVKKTEGALVKSITAFKSFRRTNLLSQEMEKWIALLATDVVSRVEQDLNRNNRYPKSCSIQYTFSKDESEERTSRSVRIPFSISTSDHSEQKMQLVVRVRDAIQSKEGSVFLHRIGLCATDFEPRLRDGGIVSYFSKVAKVESGLPKSVQGQDAEENCSTHDEHHARKLQNEHDCESGKEDTGNSDGETLPEPAKDSTEAGHAPQGDDAEKDLEYARRLQASYDRENLVLSAMESKDKNKKSREFGTVQHGRSKKMRIDNFFTKSK